MQQSYNVQAKNELQEYMQKRKHHLPVYDTMRHGGTDHEPMFLSAVILYDGSRYVGSQSSSKKTAEFSAAMAALNALVPSSTERQRSIEILVNPPEYIIKELTLSFRECLGGQNDPRNYAELTYDQVKNGVTSYLVAKYIDNPRHMDPRLIIDQGWSRQCLTDTSPRDEILDNFIIW